MGPHGHRSSTQSYSRLLMLLVIYISAYSSLASVGGNGGIATGKEITCPKNNYCELLHVFITLYNVATTDWGFFNGQHFCVRCPNGRASPGCSDCKADAQAASCKPCAVGWYLPPQSDAACIECPSGKWQSKKGMKTCYRCPKGSYTPLTGQHACYNCQSGEFQAEPGQTTCKKCPLCPAGKFVSWTFYLVLAHDNRQ